MKKRASSAGATAVIGTVALFATIVGMSAQNASSWKTRRTPWGEPDLQGIWTTDEMQAVPLERPADLAGRATLTPEEAIARREGTIKANLENEKAIQKAVEAANAIRPSRDRPDLVRLCGDPSTNSDCREKELYGLRGAKKDQLVH